MSLSPEKREATIPDYFPPSPKQNESCTAAEAKEDIKSSVLLTPDSTPTKDFSEKCQKKKLVHSLELEGGKPSVVTPNDLGSENLGKDLAQPSDPKVSKAENEVECKEQPPSTGIKSKAQSRKKGRSRAKAATPVNPSASQPKPKAPSRKKPESKNSLLTDYFPVRRSARVPSSEIKKRNQQDLEEAILSGKKDGLKVEMFEEKGRGVVSTLSFKKGDFVVEYAGDLVSLETAKEREKGYVGRTDVGCYMYYFSFKNKSYCVDATAESDKLGRLLNHSKTKPNCCTKIVGIGNRPYLILVAARDIDIGEELLYDYGDRNKETLDANPWLSF